jgi:hypothetical protein
MGIAWKNANKHTLIGKAMIDHGYFSVIPYFQINPFIDGRTHSNQRTSDHQGYSPLSADGPPSYPKNKLPNPFLQNRKFLFSSASYVFPNYYSLSSSRTPPSSVASDNHRLGLAGGSETPSAGHPVFSTVWSCWGQFMSLNIMGFIFSYMSICQWITRGILWCFNGFYSDLMGF